jgi:D-glycero-D-manno-heptose 1,7-bisphosphate phosphatase
MNNFKKAIFFDRDGVLNKEKKNYVKTIEELEIFPNIIEPIKKLKNYGFVIIVITNQSAINRGFTTHKNVKEIHRILQNHLKQNGTKIDGFYYCPHRPDENCICRKPKPGLFFKAADEFKLNLELSWMIGDNDTDTQAAISAGCKAIKINTNNDLQHSVEQILNSQQ